MTEAGFHQVALSAQHDKTVKCKTIRCNVMYFGCFSDDSAKGPQIPPVCVPGCAVCVKSLS